MAKGSIAKESFMKRVASAIGTCGQLRMARRRQSRLR